MKSFAHAFIATAALLAQDALAVTVTRTDGSKKSSKTYVELPELNEVFNKLEATQASWNAKIESVKSKLAVEKNASQKSLEAKRLDLDKLLMQEQKTTEKLTKENEDLESNIKAVDKSNAEKLQKIKALNASNLEIRAHLAALKSEMDDDDQTLDAALDNSSDARVAVILEEKSDANNTKEDDTSEDDDDKKPLSFLAVSRHLRGTKEVEDEDVSEANTEEASTSETSETSNDADADTTPAKADAAAAQASAPQEDAIANLMTQGLKQLSEQTKQEEAKIQNNFDDKMANCKNQTEVARKLQVSLQQTLSKMKKREEQLVSADQELKKAQAALKESVTKQTAFFLREVNELKMLDSQNQVQKAKDQKQKA